MNNAIGSLLNGVSAVAIGGYLAAVIVQGNANTLILEAKSDWQYIEFLLAIIAIKVALDIPYVGDAVFFLVIMAILAVGLKIVQKSDTLDALKDFGDGKTGIFATVQAIFS